MCYDIMREEKECERVKKCNLYKPMSRSNPKSPILLHATAIHGPTPLKESSVPTAGVPVELVITLPLLPLVSAASTQIVPVGHV
jgi:hypothetical protein